jgi:hypothetical protein
MSGQSARLSFSVENLLGLRKEERHNSSQERAVSPEAPLTENDELFDEENQGKLFWVICFAFVFDDNK